MPVKKSLGDWLLFRGLATVRRRLFGDDLAQEIPVEEKQKRLPQTSREALLKIADDTLYAKFPALPKTYSTRLLEDYIKKFSTEVIAGLRGLRDQLQAERAERQAPFEANTRLLEAMKALSERVGKVTGELDDLAKREGVPPLRHIPTAPEPEAAQIAALPAEREPVA